MSTKEDVHVVDDYKHDEEMSDQKRRASSHAAIDMPASLRGLAPEEIQKIGLKTTLKTDIVVMPCLVIMYILNYLDRQNIASARLAGLPEDLNLNDSQYQTCVSILFVGYSEYYRDLPMMSSYTYPCLVLMQVPSNMILSRIRYPGIYINFAMAMWGVVSACMAAVHSYTGLLLARFFIGFVEAVFFPGALFCEYS